MRENENRLYLRSHRHLYAHLQIRLRMSANDARSPGNPVAEVWIWIGTIFQYQVTSLRDRPCQPAMSG